MKLFSVSYMSDLYEYLKKMILSIIKMSKQIFSICNWLKVIILCPPFLPLFRCNMEIPMVDQLLTFKTTTSQIFILIRNMHVILKFSDQVSAFSIHK